VTNLFAAPTSRAARSTILWAFVGLFCALAVTGVTTPLGPAVPVALVLVVFGLALALGSAWHGLIGVLVAVMLLPVPFSIAVGPATVSFGRLLLFALAVGWFAQLRWRDRPFHLQRTPFDLPLLAILGAMAASTVVNLPELQGFEFVGAVRTIALYGIDFALLFWMVVSVLRSQARLLQLLRILTGLIVVTAGLGLVEFVTGNNVFEFIAPYMPGGVGRFIQQLAEASVLTRGSISRVHSTFEQPLAFGVVLLLGLPLAIGLRSIARERRGVIGWSVGTVLIGSAILTTAGRSIYLIAGISVLTMLVFLPDRRGRRTLLWSLIAVVALFFSQANARDTMLNFFHPERGNGTLEGSVNARVADYDPLLTLVEKKPVLGYGPRAFSTDQLKQSGLVTDDANLVLDNAYLTQLAETGVIGLLSLISLLAVAWCSSWRSFRRAKNRDMAVIGLGLFIAVQSWILMGLFADTYAFNAPPKLFFVLLAAVAAARRLSGWPNDLTARDATRPAATATASALAG
jgi:O-antigen ligase